MIFISPAINYWFSFYSQLLYHIAHCKEFWLQLVAKGKSKSIQGVTNGHHDIFRQSSEWVFLEFIVLLRFVIHYPHEIFMALSILVFFYVLFRKKIAYSSICLKIVDMKQTRHTFSGCWIYMSGKMHLHRAVSFSFF